MAGPEKEAGIVGRVAVAPVAVGTTALRHRPAARPSEALRLRARGRPAESVHEFVSSVVSAPVHKRGARAECERSVGVCVVQCAA